VTLEIVPGATHLFEEPGTLEEVTRLAIDWCQRYLGGRARGVEVTCA
jgi:putative phosphoribosyl transferase